MKKKIVQQFLGAFLRKFEIKNIDLFFKTGISESRISKLSNPEMDSMTADEFYLIALALNVDIDIMAEDIFKEFKSLLKPGETYKDPRLTKFGKFISNYLITQQTVSSRTDISTSRLSTLSNDITTKPLAKEIYLISLSLNRKPSEAFSFICGHLELKSKIEQDILRKAYKEKKKKEN